MKNKLKNPKLSELEKRIEELTNKWVRALADYQNLEKRVEQERSEFVKFCNATLIDKILSVLDDLERAENHLKDKGLSLTIDKLRSVMKSEGVEELLALNNKFSPETMDCIELVSGQKNIVIEIIQKGYLLNNKILRPAKVKVGKGG